MKFTKDDLKLIEDYKSQARNFLIESRIEWEKFSFFNESGYKDANKVLNRIIVPDNNT